MSYVKRLLIGGVIAVQSFQLGAICFAQITIPASGVINTIAGTGTSGYSGDAGAATSAKIFYPNGVAVDTNGNVYIADSANNVIRKITASTGDISTVAGTGRGGYSGDGGPATSAKLLYPQAVAVDSVGNLYIADTDNSCIRKVTASTGYISTIAGYGVAGSGGDGGPATNARLDLPMGIAVDSQGNVYISDYENNYVRKVSVNTQTISAYAGYQYTYSNPGTYSGDNIAATSAELSSPLGLAIDSSGNLFIADSANQRIRAVYASGSIPNVSSPIAGRIYTVAGNGTGGFSGNGGSATSAKIYNPSGVAVDPAGNLYIADSNNQRIRLVLHSNGYISTVAGNGTSGFSGDGGAATSAEMGQPGENGVPAVAVDGAYNIYIADEVNNRIRAVGAVE